MSAPAETEAKPLTPVARVFRGSSVISAEMAPPAKEYKKMEEKMEEKEEAQKEGAKPVYPVPAVEEGQMEIETDPPAHEEPAEKKPRARRLSGRITGLFKKEKKDNDDEVVAASAPHEPAYPFPAVEDALKPAEEPAEKKPRIRRLSGRITGIFKKEKKDNEDIPAVADEAPKVAEVVTVSAPHELVSTVEDALKPAKAEEKPAGETTRGAKLTRRPSTRIIGLFKKQEKDNNDIPAVADEAPKLAEVATVSAPPAYHIPAVEDALKPAEEKPVERKAREVKVTRRLSGRITGLFKKQGGKGQ